MDKEKVLMFEVENLEGLSIEQKGMRRFDCIGGSKNFQVFFAPKEWSRTDFMQNYQKHLDECVKPIFEDEDVVISHDVRYAVPGFYIVATKKKYRTIAEMDMLLYKKCVRLSYYLGKLIKEETGENCFYYYEEHVKKPASTHFWTLPIYSKVIKEQGLTPTICKFDVWDYVECFRFSLVKDKIYELNHIIKNKLRKMKNEIR